MDKEKLTEGQKKLFFEYGTIPAGYTKEDMIELTEQYRRENDERFTYKEPYIKFIGKKNTYRFCEICDRLITHRFHPPGQRYKNRYSLGLDSYGSHPANFHGYCHICHKSMCWRCSTGIVCKNCIEFFPETTKNKFLTLKKRWQIIRLCGFIIPILCILAMFSYPDPILDFEIPKILLIVLVYIVSLSNNISFYFIFKYFEDTIENFLKDLKENPQNHEDVLNKVYAVYNDSFAHPESFPNLKKYFITKLIGSIVMFTIMFGMMGVFKIL
jgi:hypothetical protein